MKKARFVLIMLLALLSAAIAPEAFAQTVYWTDRDTATLYASDLTTGARRPVAQGIYRLQDVDLDTNTGTLYFAEWGPPGTGPGSIKKVNRDGTGFGTVFTTNGAAVHQLALDQVLQRIYFTRAVSTGNHEISFVDYLGGNYTVLFFGGFSGPGWFPSGLALDAANNLLYWGDIGVLHFPPNGSVNRMTTSGGSPTQLTPHVDGRGRGFAFDPATQAIFLTSHNPVSPGTGGGLFRYDIASDVETQLINDPATGYWDVEIDPGAQRIWWTDYGRGQIKSAKFDGTDVRVELAGLTSPYGLALELRGPLDHFKCYDVEQPDNGDDDGDDDNGSGSRRRVTLKDQFGSGEAFVDQATDLCNPVEKNDEGGPNQPDAHLVSYDIDPINRRFEKRRVEVENQFGTLTLTVKEPDTLLVPSSKAHEGEDPGEPPRQLDHFQCYPTMDGDDDDHDNGARTFEPRRVTLEDQFLREEVTVVEPRAVCNPVDKNNEGIQSAEEHLTCYAITTRAGFSPRNVVVRNQFGREPLRVTNRKSLCVPSEKRDLGPVPDDDDDFDDDGERDDEDGDDDNDGTDDDEDGDDDNDGTDDDEDGDDDNDGIDDDFDSESAREYQQSTADLIEGGQEKAYDLSAGANTFLLIATAEAIGATDVLNQGLTVEIRDPSGALIATSPAVLGRAVATAVPAQLGTYKVNVRNSGSANMQYQLLRITRASWPVS